MSNLLEFRPKRTYDFWKTLSNGESIISNFKDNFTINQVATTIWNLINGKNSVEQIADIVSKKYNQLKHTVLRDILEILLYWHSEDLAIFNYHPLYKLGQLNKNLPGLQLDTIYSTNTELIYTAIKNAQQQDLIVTGSMIIGIPGESLESIQKTFDFGYKLQREYEANIMVAWFVPYPGSYYSEHLADYQVTLINGKDYDLYSTLYPNIIGRNMDLTTMRNLYYDNMIKLMSGNKAKTYMRNIDLSFFKYKTSYLYKNEYVYEV